MNGKQLKNSILQWAIQGKLVSQDPNDEPATLLLQRIRDEKARLIKEGKLKRDKNETIIYRGDDNSHYEKFADGKVRCIDDEIPFEIPNSWTWCRIRDISQSYIGLTYAPTDVSTQGTIVLRSSNIKDGKLDLSDIVRVNKTINEKLQVNVNDIIICARNGSKKLVGKSAIVKELNEPMTFGAFMAICKTQLYNYIYLFLQSDLFFSQLRKVSDTTTINQLTQNNFNGFLVPIPPYSEQERIIAKYKELLPIVEKYGSVQEELDKLNSTIFDTIKKSILQEAIQGRLVEQAPSEEPAIKLLERIRKEKQALVKQGKLKPKDITDSIIFKSDDNKYYEKCGNVVNCIDKEIPFEIPRNWQWVRIKNIFQTTSGGTPIKGHPEYYINGTIPWVKSGELKTKYLYDSEDKITQEALEHSSVKYFPINTVAVAMYGATIGKTSIFKSELTTNQAICGIFPIPYVIPEYLYYFIQYKTTDYLSIAFGSGQPNISQDKIKNTLFPLPPLAEQHRIVAKIENCLDVMCKK